MHHNDAFEFVETTLVMTPHKKCLIVVEDANKNKYHGERNWKIISPKGKVTYSADPNRFYGAGAIKFNCNLWIDWGKRFDDNDRVEFDFIKPISGSKMDDLHFRQLTKWNKRCNQHARDAGIIAMFYPSKSIEVPRYLGRD